MTTFDNRELGYEAKFAHDQEMMFKAKIRRDRMIGHWVAEKLGYAEDVAERYADAIVHSNIKHADDEHVVARIKEDLVSLEETWSEHRIRQKLSHFMSVALGEVTANA